MVWLNLRHRWTSKSCLPSLPWHKVRKPPQRVVHWRLSPPDGSHLGCGIRQRLPCFLPSPVTLCLHLHYSADPPHLKKNPFEPLRRRECMQRSLWRQPRNRPIPLTCSVVKQVMAIFRKFYSLWKVKIWVKKGQKGAMRFKQVQRFIWAKEIFWG